MVAKQLLLLLFCHISDQLSSCVVLILCSHQDLSGNLLALHLDSGNSCIERRTWASAVFIAAGSNPYSLVDTAGESSLSAV
jgi:hypothetical protein